MPNACVLLADGFEEIEAIVVIDVLRRAGIDVVTVGTRGTQVTGSHGVPIEADSTLETCADTNWDAVVLPGGLGGIAAGGGQGGAELLAKAVGTGGLPGATHLRDDAQGRELLRRPHESGRTVAAICAAPIALGSAGVLEGRRATCYPGFEDQMIGASRSADRVVADGNVVTSRGPGTAFDFALMLVARLVDEETAEALRDGMLLST